MKVRGYLIIYLPNFVNKHQVQVFELNLLVYQILFLFLLDAYPLFLIDSFIYDDSVRIHS